MSKSKDNINQSKKTNMVGKIKSLQEEIAKLKKKLEDDEWASRKTNEGIKILYKDLEKKKENLIKELIERKRAEEALREAKNFAESLISSAMDGIVVTDSKGDFIQLNDAFLNMMGYSDEELKNISFHQITPKKWREKDAAQFKKLSLEGESIANYNKELIRKNGSVFPVNLSISLLTGEDGEPFVMMAIIRDETERKKAEKALRESEAFNFTLFQYNPIETIILDHAGKVIKSNMAKKKSGDRMPNIGDVMYKDYAGKHKIDMYAELMKCISSKKTKRFPEMKYDGKFLDITIAPFPQGAIITSQDITERKQAEDKLKKTMEELERSNEELEQFAYVASHDLQEPLRVVASFTQLLAKRYKDKLDADANDFIQYAVEGARRMQELINGLLAYSRVTTRGKEFEPTDCKEVIDEAVKNLKLMIEESGATITYEYLPTVMADNVQMIQLFQNLISNAIKFRSKEPTRINISAKRVRNSKLPLQKSESSNQKSESWLFSIQDNGIGIDPKFKGRIFTIFQRLHLREKYPGIGIGLTICKRIVNRHGGIIWVESKPEKGSTFYFTIPIKGE